MLLYLFHTFAVKVAQEVVDLAILPQGLLSNVNLNVMQDINLSSEAQNAAIPQSMINIFAQSLCAQLEALAMEANTLLELFENQEYTEMKTMLQAHIQYKQHLFNNVGMLEILEQPQA